MNKTDYIPHSLIDSIRPCYDDTADRQLVVELKDGTLYYTKSEVATSANGIFGEFETSDTGFPPGSQNDEVARLAAHG